MLNFSIVIPLYNKQNFISDTIKSVLLQSHVNFELLIIDDGSTDESVSRVLDFSDRRIRLIRKNNGGVSSARNKGIEESAYSYVSFLDADDIWEPTYLEEQSKLIHDFPDAAMWGMNFSPVAKGIEENLETGLPKNYRGYVFHYFSMKRVSDLFHSSSVVIKKEAINKVGLFDQRIKYSEDLDMWYRIILNFPVVFYNKIMVKYLLDAENRALNKKYKLKDFLPYYVSKFNDYCKVDKEFSNFIHTFSAAHIRNYYFGSKEEREDARLVIKCLKYNDIHPKYRYWYKTPYMIGKFFYSITKLKQKYLNKYGFVVCHSRIRK